MDIQLEFPFAHEVELEQHTIPIEIMTCWKCIANMTCPFAWDDYNIEGSCLAEQ